MNAAGGRGAGTGRRGGEGLTPLGRCDLLGCVHERSPRHVASAMRPALQVALPVALLTAAAAVAAAIDLDALPTEATDPLMATDPPTREAAEAAAVSEHNNQRCKGARQ